MRRPRTAPAAPRRALPTRSRRGGWLAPARSPRVRTTASYVPHNSSGPAASSGPRLYTNAHASLHGLEQPSNACIGHGSLRREDSHRVGFPGKGNGTSRQIETTCVARNQMPRQGCDQIDLRQLDERHHEIRNREHNTPRLPLLGKLGIDGTIRIANRGHEHVARRQVGFEARLRARGWAFAHGDDKILSEEQALGKPWWRWSNRQNRKTP